MRALAYTSFAISLLFATAAAAKDSCRAQLPKALDAAVMAAFPGYRLPLESDNSADDAEFNRQQGGTGCLGVAIADFNGDGAGDFLLGLTGTDQPDSAKAVVALSTLSGWHFEPIRSWLESARPRLYVSVAKPDTYERTEALDGPLAPGERQSMKCEYPGAQVGATESTGIVYCFKDGHWPYVWVSD